MDTSSSRHGFHNIHYFGVNAIVFPKLLQLTTLGVCEKYFLHITKCYTRKEIVFSVGLNYGLNLDVANGIHFLS